MKSGHIISPPNISDYNRSDEIPTKIEREVGEYIPVNYKKAIELTKGYVIWSDRVGGYAFARDPPSILHTQMQAPPSTMRFEYNRSTKIVRTYNGSRIISVERVS